MQVSRYNLCINIPRSCLPFKHTPYIAILTNSELSSQSSRSNKSFQNHLIHHPQQKKIPPQQPHSPKKDGHHQSTSRHNPDPPRNRSSLPILTSSSPLRSSTITSNNPPPLPMLSKRRSANPTHRCHHNIQQAATSSLL